MRIAIVNDLKMSIEVLKRFILESNGHKIVWVADDGAEAVKKCAVDTPDLILMDLVMPIMNGLEATRLIMKNNPCAILIVTASVGAHASMVFEAMGFGALDVVAMPSLVSAEGGVVGAEFKRKLQVIEKYLGFSRDKESLKIPFSKPASNRVPPLLVIGASTGGPTALAKIFQKMPRDVLYAIIVVQHVDEQFTEGFVEWMGNRTALAVKLAKEGDAPKPGHVLIAGGDKHLVITANLTLAYRDHPEDVAYSPSVDVFFQSVAEYWPRKSVAILLTGMGNDGARGLKALHDKGWHTIAQNQASCIVFGMSKAAIEQGGVTEILALEDIHNSLVKLLEIT